MYCCPKARARRTEIVAAIGAKCVETGLNELKKFGIAKAPSFGLDFLATFSSMEKVARKRYKID